MEEDEIIGLLKKLVEYEMECIKHQPQLFDNPEAKLEDHACEKCPLNKKESELCELGEVRDKLRELFLAKRVPKIFEQLIFCINLEALRKRAR